jgi:hypothetical protein
VDDSWIHVNGMNPVVAGIFLIAGILAISTLIAYGFSEVLRIAYKGSEERLYRRREAFDLRVESALEAYSNRKITKQQFLTLMYNARRDWKKELD